LIDINRIAALDHLGTSSNELVVGALTRHAAFHLPVVTGPLGVLLAGVVRQIAHVPIPTRGTVVRQSRARGPGVGVVHGRGHARRNNRRCWQSGTTRYSGCRILPRHHDDSARERRNDRRPGDFAIAMSLAVLRMSDSRIVEARIGLGGIEAYPGRMKAAEDLYRGLLLFSASSGLWTALPGVSASTQLRYAGAT
jgi:carbon-monoxide dehydrogenase medium subunit